MNDYYKVRIDLAPCCEDATDLMAALLADAGFESFVPDETGLAAYAKAEDYDQASVDTIFADFPFDCKITSSAELVPGQDWNAEWEKNYFQPIIVDDKCVIHSSFHTGFPACEYDITIDPKMAFGTGHHSTTSLIIERLLQMPLHGKSVIDMGTGTGILAILAAMRGATPVTGIEIDGFAYENALDNVKANGYPQIRLIHGDASALATVPQADVLIANINRNIITADMGAYAAALKPGGTMILSGFYQSDAPVVAAAALVYGIRQTSITTKPDGWASISLAKKLTPA